RAWQCEGSLALFRLELERAADCYRRALEARRGDDPDDAVERAWSIRALSLIAGLGGRHEEALALSNQAMEMFRELGETGARGLVRSDQAMAALVRGAHDRARALLEDAIAEARGGNPDHLDNTLIGLGILELREQRLAEAASIFVDVLESSLARGTRGTL